MLDHEKRMKLAIIISLFFFLPSILEINAPSESTPAVSLQIIEVGHISTNEPVLDLEVNDNLAYFIEKDRGFVIYDVGDFSNITLIGEYFLPSPHDLSLQNNRAFVIDPTMGVVILDISNPQNIVELGVFANTSDGTHINTVGNTLCVGDEMEGLLLVNTSDPSTPTLLGKWEDNEGGVSGVYPIDDYIFVGIQLGRIAAPPLSLGLKILNVSSVTNVSEVATIGDGEEFSSMAPQDHVGNQVYLADLDYGFKILNFTEPTDINTIGHFFDDGSAHDVQVHTNKAFIADGDDGLEIIDIANPSNLTKLAQYSTTSMALNLHVVDETIYLVTLSNGICILEYTSKIITNETTTTTTIRSTPEWFSFFVVTILLVMGLKLKRK